MIAQKIEICSFSADFFEEPIAIDIMGDLEH